MSEDKKFVRVLELPCDAKDFASDWASWEDAEDQLSAIQRLIEEGLYPEEKARIIAEKFQGQFKSISTQLQLHYYEALERAEPEIAIVREFLQRYGSRIQALHKKNEQEKKLGDGGASESEKLLTKIEELRKYCDDLSLIRNEMGLWQTYKILEKAAEKIINSKFDVAAACLRLFIKNSCKFEIAYQFIYDLLKMMNQVLLAYDSANQVSKNRVNKTFLDMQSSINALKIFCNQLKLSEQSDEKLDKLRSKFQVAAPIRFFKSGQDTNDPIGRELQQIDEILAEVSRLIELGSAKNKFSGLKFSDFDVKRLWGTTKIAQLQEKYFIPLGQAEITLRHIDESLRKTREIMQNFGSLEPENIQQRDKIQGLQKRHTTLSQQCKTERIKRSVIFLKEAIKELTLLPSNDAFIIDCIVVFLNERRRNPILSNEIAETLRVIAGVEKAYQIFKQQKKAQLKNNPQEFDIVKNAMDEPFNQLMAYSRELQQKSLPSSSYSLA